MKKSFLSLATPLLLAFSSPLEAAIPSNMTHMVDFRSVASKGIPAVVSIRVNGSANSGLTVESFLHDDRYEAFGDPFWDRFFGLPFPKNKMPQAKQPQLMGQASGFIISSDGYILTNSHVVKDASEIIVTLLNGNDYPAKIIGQDPNTDIALIKIDQKELPFLKLGNSDKLDVGEWVIAIGNPLGLQASLTAGVVSAVGRNNLDLARIEDFIQTDAAINQGNSGGPLLDLTGDVVGINTAIVTNKGGGGYMGIGFAIPSNIVTNILEQLKTKGSVTRGYLGLSLQKVDAEIAAALGLSKTEGSLIAEVIKNSPAEKSGLKQGDVIVSYNNQTVKDNSALRNTVALAKPGDRAKVGLFREGKPINVEVEIGELPPEFIASASNTGAQQVGVSINKLGMSVGAIPEGSLNGNEGVIITQVDSNSPAAWVGLRKGAIILNVNQKKIATPDEFEKAVAETEPNKPLLMLIKQGETVRYISLKLS